MTFTRPNLVCDVILITRYMKKSIEIHLNATTIILKYVKGTIDFGSSTRKVKLSKRLYIQ